MGSSGKIQVQLGQEIGWTPWEKPEDTGEFADYTDALSEEAAGGLEGWVRVDKGEGILKMMEMITNSFDVFRWKVEVFPSGSFYFLYKVRNGMIYQEGKGQLGMGKKERRFKTVMWKETQVSRMY